MIASWSEHHVNYGGPGGHALPPVALLQFCHAIAIAPMNSVAPLALLHCHCSNAVVPLASLQCKNFRGNPFVFRHCCYFTCWGGRSQFLLKLFNCSLKSVSRGQLVEYSNLHTKFEIAEHPRAWSSALHDLSHSEHTVGEHTVGAEVSFAVSLFTMFMTWHGYTG